MLFEFLASGPPPLDAYIDLHCERTQDGLFEEPLNTLSNIFFFITAFFLWKKLGKSHVSHTRFLRALVIITPFIGIGSTIFHMTARMWGSIVDVTPIAIFAVILIYNFARIPFGLNKIQSVAAVAGYAVINVIYKSIFIKSLDGYVSLFPSVGILWVLSLYMLHRHNPSAVVFLKATAIATIAVTCRAVDTMMNEAGTCESLLWGNGTHFIWHSLMAWFIFILVEELIIRRLAEVSNKEKLLSKLRRSKEGLKLKDGLRYMRRARKASKDSS